MSISKKPAEFLLIGVDMTRALAAGESITSSNANGTLTATALDSSGADVSTTVVEGSPSINGNIAQVMVKSGSGVYTIHFLVPTSTGQVLEEDVTISVVASH